MTKELERQFFLDPTILRNAARGENVFKRGQSYYKEGSVDIDSIDEYEVRGRILGTHSYKAVLTYREGRLSAQCSCPAAYDNGFCKHLVALGLAANDIFESNAELNPENSKSKHVHYKSRREKLHNYLQTLKNDSLVQWILDQAEMSPSVFKGLEFAARSAQGETEKVEGLLRKEITKATQTRGGFVDYDRAPNWTKRFENLLAQIIPLIHGGSAGLALDLLDYVFDRMETALENIDDSDGEVGSLCQKAASMYRQACTVLKPSPQDLAKRLFPRETESNWSFFSDNCREYRELLGERGLELYHEMAENEWRKLPSLNSERSHDSHASKRFALKSILDISAEKEDNLDVRIALRVKELSSPIHYQELAELCSANGKDEDALKWAEEGLWQFKSKQGVPETLEAMVFRLYLKLGQKQKAENIIWESFQRQPDMHKYREIKKISAKLAKAALSLIEQQSREGRDASKGKPEFEKLVIHKFGGIGYGQRVDVASVVLFKILFLIEEDIAGAWKMVEEYALPDELLTALCKASFKQYPDFTLRTYRKLVDDYVTQTSSAAYKKALVIIEDIKNLEKPEEFTTYLSGLKAKYKKKSSFINMLDTVVTRY